jgi:hypothetical protein
VSSSGDDAPVVSSSDGEVVSGPMVSPASTVPSVATSDEEGEVKASSITVSVEEGEVKASSITVSVEEGELIASSVLVLAAIGSADEVL